MATKLQFHRVAKAARLREEAERIARRIAGEQSDTHDWQVAYAAALVALADRDE